MTLWRSFQHHHWWSWSNNHLQRSMQFPRLGLLHGNGNDFWRQEGLCDQREYDGCQEQNQCLLIWDSSNRCRQDWDQSKQHQWRISRMFRIQLDCDLQQAAASNPHHSNISASAKLLRVSSSASSILVVYDSTSSFIVDFVLSWDSSTSMLPIGSEVGKQATLESQMSICLSVHYQNPSTAWNHHPSSSSFIHYHSSFILPSFRDF